MKFSRRTLVCTLACSAASAVVLRNVLPARVARVENFQALCPAYVWPLLVPGARLHVRLTPRARQPRLYIGEDEIGTLPGLRPSANLRVTVFRLDIDEFARRHLSVRVVG
jgi:hypothetical protein